MTLGEKLVELRQRTGLSQDRVAEILGVSRQAVSKWERDEAKPDLDNIVNISNIYNVTTDYLLKEKTEEKKLGKQQSTSASHGSSVFQDIMRFVKEKWYWLGYGLAGWGIIDIIKSIVQNIMWKSFASSIMGYDPTALQADISSSASQVLEGEQAIDPFVDTVMNASSYALWFPILIGLLKVAAGIIIVIFGKRYIQRVKAKGYK